MLALPMLTRHTFEKGDSCVEKAFFDKQVAIVLVFLIMYERREKDKKDKQKRNRIMRPSRPPHANDFHRPMLSFLLLVMFMSFVSFNS